MRLYYSPASCALAPHIVLCELGLPHTLTKVDLGSKKTEDGKDFYAINPKGYVPALQLEDGTVLSEVAAILQYLADRKPEAQLAPANGTMERYRLQEWLNFIATELHKGFGPLWDRSAPAEVKQGARAKLARRLEWVNPQLQSRAFLTGEQFTVADAYLFTVANWAGFVEVDLTPFPAVQAFMGRVAARAGVQQALEAQGLLK